MRIAAISVCLYQQNATMPLTAPQHLVCRAVQSLHINHMQAGIIEVFICRRLHMNTSTILICIWLVCTLCTTLHTKCCGAVTGTNFEARVYPARNRLAQACVLLFYRPFSSLGYFRKSCESTWRTCIV